MAGTSVEMHFAGELRRFEWRPLPFRWDETFGSLAEIVVLARQGTLSSGAVRHVLIVGLCAGEMTRRIWAEPLVDKEIDGKPLSELIPIVMSIVVAAFAGAMAEPME